MHSLLLGCLILPIAFLQATPIASERTAFSGWGVFELDIPPEGVYLKTSDRKIIWSVEAGAPSTIHIVDLQTGKTTEYVISGSAKTCPGLQPFHSRWSFDWPWLVMPANCSGEPGFYFEFLAAFNLETGEEKFIPPPVGETPPDDVEEPYLYENQVAWVARNYYSDEPPYDIDRGSHRIYHSDVETGESWIVPDRPAPASEWSPAVYGDWVAWDIVHLNQYTHTVQLYNVTTTEHLTVPHPAYTPFPYPRFDGDWMVWAGVADTPDRQAANRRSVSAPPYRTVFKGVHLEDYQITTLFDSDTLGEVGSLLYSCQIFDAQLACFGSDDAVRVYDMQTQELVTIFSGEANEPLSFSRLSAKDDVIVWSASTLFTNELTRYAAVKVSHYVLLPVVVSP
ncbi:MAG: hypothetical protein M9918_17025 [Anaerolineae bacterium]|nr:hypothetical protein [Anaerolineae bacterium]MCO5192343.1 hypothetical protein [Anaerolineae bacterium]